MVAAFLLSAAISATPSMRFQRNVIDVYPGGYQVAVADLNGDGRPDVVALSTEGNRVDWYENPTWKRRAVTAIDRPIDLAMNDVDGDGLPEIALASGFYFAESVRGGEIQWLKANGGLDASWTIHRIGRNPVTHRLRFADVDGDGRKELIHAPIFGPGSEGARSPKPARLTLFRPPRDFSEKNWEEETIDESLTVLHGLWTGKLDRSGRDQVLTASYEGVFRFHYEGVHPSGRWRKKFLFPGSAPKEPNPGANRGSSEIVPVRLHGGQWLLATIEPWHGNQVVVYAPSTSQTSPFPETWQRHVLDEGLVEGHVLTAADFDGDGDDELVAGWRGGKGGLTLYDRVEGKTVRFTSLSVDRGIAAEGAAVVDLNGDGRLDLVVVAGRTKDLVWYENRQ
jgi:hypothetical protein